MGFLSGGLGALVGLGSSILGNYYNKKAQSKQNDVQWQMWQMNNDYNSPASVMQRLEEAGLNPNLVYGNGGASYQATMPTAAKRAPADFNTGINPLSFQQMENMEAQQNLLDEQIDNTKAQADNAKTQNRILKANARVAEKDADTYEKTGVRPGDDISKGIWHTFVNNVKEMQLSHLREMFPIFKQILRSTPRDVHTGSQNNSANVKFRD